MQKTLQRLVSRPVAAAAIATGAVALALGAPASPAQAATQNCYNRTGPTYGAWSTQKAYTFGRGGWCMHATNDASYRLVFQSDGNLVAYFNISDNNPRNARWSSHTAGRGARLSFQVDGNLVVYDSGNHALWASGASSNRNRSTTYRLVFQNVLGGNGKAYEQLELTQHTPFGYLWRQRV